MVPTKPAGAASLEGSSCGVAGLIFHSLKPCQGRYFDPCMIPRLLMLLAFLAIAAAHRTQAASNANRLTYLDETDPFCPRLSFSRLTTPQWVGEEGVEAAVILSLIHI